MSTAKIADPMDPMDGETEPGLQRYRYRLLAIDPDTNRTLTPICHVERIDCSFDEGAEFPLSIERVFLPMTANEYFSLTVPDFPGPPALIEYEITVRRLTPPPGAAE